MQTYNFAGNTDGVTFNLIISILRSMIYREKENTNVRDFNRIEYEWVFGSWGL